jgi:hypothetical protein
MVVIFLFLPRETGHDKVTSAKQVGRLRVESHEICGVEERGRGSGCETSLRTHYVTNRCYSRDLFKDLATTVFPTSFSVATTALLDDYSQHLDHVR